MKKIFYWLLFLWISVLLAFIYFLSGIEQGGKEEERIITKIIDGDTIIVEGGETIRLLGIDCDEKGKKCYTPAKNYIENNFLGKTAVLKSGKDDKDIYGRSLRYIFVDGKNVNVEMVAQGFCVARIQDEDKYSNEIRAAESDAIVGKIGCKWKI